MTTDRQSELVQSRRRSFSEVRSQPGQGTAHCIKLVQ